MRQPTVCGGCSIHLEQHACKVAEIYYTDDLRAGAFSHKHREKSNRCILPYDMPLYGYSGCGAIGRYNRPVRRFAELTIRAKARIIHTLVTQCAACVFVCPEALAHETDLWRSNQCSIVRKQQWRSVH